MKVVAALAALLGAAPPATADDARDWLARAGERSLAWTDHGALTLPSGRLFVGDPTGGGAYHMTATGAVEGPLRLLTARDPDAPNPDANALIWLEAGGTPPVATGTRLGFGVDGATLALGSVEAGEAFTALEEIELDAGRGDNFDWIMPHIQISNDFAYWLGVPPGDERMFLATTRADGGYEAVWLLDADGAVSGILIDISGRASDGLYIDTTLPEGD